MNGCQRAGQPLAVQPPVLPIPLHSPSSVNMIHVQSPAHSPSNFGTSPLASPTRQQLPSGQRSPVPVFQSYTMPSSPSSPSVTHVIASRIPASQDKPKVPAGIHTHTPVVMAPLRSVPAAAPALTSRTCRSPPQPWVPMGVATSQSIAAPSQGLRKPAPSGDFLSATWTGPPTGALDRTWQSVHVEVAVSGSPLGQLQTSPTASAKSRPRPSPASTCTPSSLSQDTFSADHRSFSISAGSQASLEDRRGWAITQTLRVGSDAEKSQLAGKARFLERSSCESVKHAIEQLNKGTLQCPEGLIVVYSASSGVNYLLYRSDQQEAVSAIAEQLSRSPTNNGFQVQPVAEATPTRQQQLISSVDTNGSAGPVPLSKRGGESESSSPQRPVSSSILHRSPSLSNRTTSFSARTNGTTSSPAKDHVSRSSNPLPKARAGAQQKLLQQQLQAVSLQQPSQTQTSEAQQAQSKQSSTAHESADSGDTALGCAASKKAAVSQSANAPQQPSKSSAVAALAKSTAGSTSPATSMATLPAGGSGSISPSGSGAASSPSRAQLQPATTPPRGSLSPTSSGAAVSSSGPGQQAVPRSPSKGEGSSSRRAGSQTGREVDINGKRFVLNEVIGRGAFGVVWLAEERTSGSSGGCFAVKVVTAKDQPALAAATFEAELLQILTAASRHSSTHVPNYFAHTVTRNQGGTGSGMVRLAMSFVPGGPLDKWLYGITDEDHKTVDVAQLVDGHLPGGQQGSWRLMSACAAVRDQLSQMAAVFSSLQPIAFHRDVSSHNVLVNFPENSDRPEFALIDFGLAVRSGSWNREWRNSNLAGDPRYWTPSAWMAFAFGFKYVATHPNSGYQRQYMSRIDHFSLGILGLETLFALWNTGEAYEGKNPGLLEIRAAWVKYWIAVIHLFQMFHMQGAQEVRQFLSQSQDEGVSSLVAYLRQLRQSLRVAAVHHLNAPCAALLLVLADLIDEKGTVSWNEIPAMLGEDLQSQAAVVPSPASKNSSAATPAQADKFRRPSLALIEPQSPSRRPTHTRIRSMMEHDMRRPEPEVVSSPLLLKNAWQDVSSAQLSPVNSAVAKTDMLSRSFSHRRRTSGYI